MSSLASFLILIVSLTALVVAYLTKQFQEENLIYSQTNQMKNLTVGQQCSVSLQLLAHTQQLVKLFLVGSNDKFFIHYN